jgi:hypothetical protein
MLIASLLAHLLTAQPTPLPELIQANIIEKAGYYPARRCWHDSRTSSRMCEHGDRR